jgi:hypothetical protein
MIITLIVLPPDAPELSTRGAEPTAGACLILPTQYFLFSADRLVEYARHHDSHRDG